MNSRMDVANKVLASIVTSRPPEDAYYEAYANGREHGYAIVAGYFGLGRKQPVKVAFSESRNSDEIVVYVGKYNNFDMAGNVPNHNAWANRKYFAPDDIEGAASYILDALNTK